MFSKRKYEILLEFFKKELNRCDFISNETFTGNYYINCNSKEWIVIEKINFETIFYNPKYFDDFLFTIFESSEYESIGYPNLIKKLMIDSIEVLNEKFNYELGDDYLKNKIMKSTFSPSVMLHPQTIEMLINRIKENDYEGNFIQ